MPDLYHASKRSTGDMLSMIPPISVPEYQRNYSWTITEVETFWADLIRFNERYPSVKIAHQEYFLGSMVVVEEREGMVLLDGQQRLATVAILLSSIRDAVRPHHAVAAERLAQQYLKWVDPFDPDKSRYQITLNSLDRVFFEREILDTRDETWIQPEAGGISHQRIRRAREFFDGKLIQLFRGDREVAEACQESFRLGTVVTTHFTVVQVSSKDEDNAAEVFETLNDRGLSLSTADLLQNLLLRRTGCARRPEAKRRWSHMLNILAKTRTEEFLRHFWISREGDVKTKSLYRAIKDEVEACDIDGVTFAQLLETDATTYKEILRGTTPKPYLQKLERDLGLLGGRVLLPLALSARTRTDHDNHAVLKAAITLFVRHTLIGKRANSDLENSLFRAAKATRESVPVDEVLRILRALLPSDSDFKREFATASLSRAGQQKYVLSEIELFLRETGEFIVAPSITVEHVYPRTPVFPRWVEHDDIVNRIGNLTLLSRRLNSQARNAEFDRKKPSYITSTISITADIAGEESWNVGAISQRQDRMAEVAVSVWPSF